MHVLVVLIARAINSRKPDILQLILVSVAVHVYMFQCFEVTSVTSPKFIANKNLIRKKKNLNLTFRYYITYILLCLNIILVSNAQYENKN